MLQDTLREVADMAQSYRAPGNPQELMAKQTEFARKSFEAALKNAGEVAELARKSGTESIDILRARIKEALRGSCDDGQGSPRHRRWAPSGHGPNLPNISMKESDSACLAMTVFSPLPRLRTPSTGE